MTAAGSRVWVLLQERSHPDGSDSTRVMGVYSDMLGLWERVENIQRANPQYPLRKVGDTVWRIGPDEDEGFFGNQPVHLRAVETTFHNGADTPAGP